MKIIWKARNQIESKQNKTITITEKLVTTLLTTKCIIANSGKRPGTIASFSVQFFIFGGKILDSQLVKMALNEREIKIKFI